MELRTLGKTGLKVSALSFGASPLGGAFGNVDEADGIRALHLSLDNGINFIDTSPFYGITKSETILGKALKGISRDKYYLATKCGRYGHDPKDFDFSAKRVTRSIDESLERMRLDYVDILHCHDIEFVDLKQIINETIPALRKIQQSGKARWIGITGLPLAIYKKVASKVEIDVMLSYCHYELNDTSLDNLVPYLQAKEIGIINASPLGMGLLTHRGTPDWHPAPANVKAACVKAAAHCKAKGADISKLAIQFALANRDIATTLVGSASSENMKQNIAWASEPMDKALLAEVQAILKPVHNATWQSGRPENN